MVQSHTMNDNDYIKLTLMNVNGLDAVEIDVYASKETLTGMIYSAMYNNHFFANSVLDATDKYYDHLDRFDAIARLN